MNKRLFVFALCAIMLAGCGADPESVEISRDSTSKATSEKSGSILDDVITFDETESNENTSSETQAACVAKALHGGNISGKVKDGSEFYKYVKDALKGTETASNAEFSKNLNVGFMQGENKYVLAYCGRGVFAIKDMKDLSIDYYKPDEDTAGKLRDTMIAYAALGEVFGGVPLSVSAEHDVTDLLTQAAAEVTDSCAETRSYLYDGGTMDVTMCIDNGSIYYLQQDTQKHYYENVTDAEGKSYYRTNKDGLFYPEVGFQGDVIPMPLATAMTGQGQKYLYSFGVSVDDIEYTVEVRKDGEALDYALMDGTQIIAMWEYSEDLGIDLMENYTLETDGHDKVAEMILYVREHQGTVEEGIPTFSRYDKALREDTEKYGLFDLSGDVMVTGDCEPTGVVEEWRSYINTPGNPFTLEYRWAGSGRNEYQISTTDGKDYYYRNDMELHKDDDDLGSEEIVIGDTVYSSVYYIKDYDKREFTSRPQDPEYPAKLVTDLLFENEDYMEGYEGKCEKAYKIMIDGEEYICEEWSLYLGRLWKVYIKDGNIVAWEGDFYEEPTVNTIIRLEKKADTELIQVPKNSKKYVSND